MMVQILGLSESEVLSAAEADAHESAAFRFSVAGVSELAPAISLAVSPESGAAWTGDFFGGHEDFSLVVLGVGGSDDDSLLVVAGGVGYKVSAHQPEDFVVVSLRPVRDALVDSEAGIVVLVGYTSLLGIGAQGESWATERLVWDGFTEARIVSGRVLVRGFDAPSNRDVEITLNAVSGEVISRS